MDAYRCLSDAYHKKAKSLFLSEFLTPETEGKLCWGKSLLALESMAEMGGISKAAPLGSLEDGDFGELGQQSFSYGKTGA